MFWAMNVTGNNRERSAVVVGIAKDEYASSLSSSVLSDEYFYPVDVSVKKGNAELRLYLTKEEAERLSKELLDGLRVLDAIDVERGCK